MQYKFNLDNLQNDEMQQQLLRVDPTVLDIGNVLVLSKKLTALLKYQTVN